jgi:excisionase family DNA binding protein
MEGNMTIREVAIKLGVTFTHVYNMVRAERLPGAFKEDGVWRVPAAALDTYLGRRDHRNRTSTQNAGSGEGQVEAAA